MNSVLKQKKKSSNSISSLKYAATAWKLTTRYFSATDILGIYLVLIAWLIFCKPVMGFKIETPDVEIYKNNKIGLSIGMMIFTSQNTAIIKNTFFTITNTQNT